jgi:hypothetical protein
MKMSEDERAGLETLKAKMPEDLALEVVKFRRTKKAPITARIARSLLREYEAYGDVEKAADIHMMRGWTGFEAVWVKKAQGFTDQNHPTPRQPQTREEYIREAIRKNNDEWEGNSRARDVRSVISQATRQ